MNPVDVLTVEHEVVRRYVETLQAAARCLRRGDVLPGSHIDGLMRLSREFVEDFHHVKEEGRLFPLLAESRGEILAEHLEVLARQHREGHARTAAIESAARAYLAGEHDGAAILANQLEGYADLLTRHAHREDNVFFPLAREVLSDADWEALGRAFRDEEARFPRNFLSTCVDRLRELRSELHELSRVHGRPTA